jgi:hypothetical protein
MGGDAPFKAQLVLTVDLRAKIVRTKTLLELLYGDRGTYSLSPDEQRPNRNGRKLSSSTGTRNDVSAISINLGGECHEGTPFDVAYAVARF